MTVELIHDLGQALGDDLRELVVSPEAYERLRAEARPFVQFRDRSTSGDPPDSMRIAGVLVRRPTPERPEGREIRRYTVPADVLMRRLMGED